MLTANEIIALAVEKAKVGYTGTDGNPVGFTLTCQRELNGILSDLCMERDLAAARGLYTFTLSPTQTSTVNGVTNFGGPYPFPMDYLRASGSTGSDGYQTGFWYIYTAAGGFQSQPMPLFPWDLGHYDMLVQLPNPSFPQQYATDISPEQTQNDRIVFRTTATTTLNSTSIVTATAAPASVLAGMGVAGQGIAQGTTVVSVSGTTIVLSIAATATFSSGASIFIGIQPNAYIWPGSNGNYPAFLRYQRRMPNITDFTRVPWFEGDGYLIEELASRLCGTSGDDRKIKFHLSAEERLSAYTKLSDDKTSRAQTVVLDARRFNTGYPAWWNRLSNTKQSGW